jgi:hypothetical protein
MLIQAGFPGVQKSFSIASTGVVFSGAEGPLARRIEMDLLTKLPEMSDDALANLRTNARRLQHSGTPTQQSDAAALLPAVEAEIGARRLAKVKTTRSVARKPRSSRPVKPNTQSAADSE